MEDTFSASTDVSAPDTSGASADTTSASGSTGAGEQVSQTPVSNEQSAPATPTADDSIDIGWKYGDDEDKPAIPDDDSDIEQMQGDAALDPARTPGLVTALRNARQEVRATKAELAQLRQQGNSAQSDFTPQQNETFNRLLRPSAENGGIPAALDDLFTNARPVYQQMASNVIESDPDYALFKLQEMGKIPANLQGPAATLDADALSQIPESLRGIAQKLATEQPAVLADLMLQDAPVRDFHLNREMKLADLDSRTQQAERQQWAQQQSTAKAQGEQAFTEMSEQYEQAHYAQLAKWSPFGPEDAPGNQQLYQSVMEGAFSELLNDSKFAKMYKDVNDAIKKAPGRRLENEGYAADQDERAARLQAAQMNARLGQMIKARVEKLDSVFRDARAYREQQRQNAPQRTEFAGSAQVANGNRPSALDKDGRVSADYKRRLAESLDATFRQ